MRTEKTHLRRRIAAIFIIALMFTTMIPVLGGDIWPAASAASVTASGKISDNDVNMRSEPDTKSQIVGNFNKGTVLTIHKEVFTSRVSTSATKRWYYVTAGTKTGYVRSDLVDSISYGSTAATTTDDLNYRKGPAVTFGKLGTALAGNPVTVLLPASRDGSSENWYKVSVAGEIAYVIADYVGIGTASPLTQPQQADLSGKSDPPRLLLSRSRPTSAESPTSRNPSSRLLRSAAVRGSYIPSIQATAAGSSRSKATRMQRSLRAWHSPAASTTSSTEWP